jgi:hypothetical protein
MDEYRTLRCASTRPPSPDPHLILMDDERTIGLLQEIRDIHREHLEAYRRGLQNQEESVRMQRGMQDDYRRRMRVVLVLIGVVLLLAGVLMVRLAMVYT